MTALFLICAMALPPNPLAEYKFLSNIAEAYGAEKIILREQRPHAVPAHSQKMPFLWRGFQVYFQNRKKEPLSEMARFVQLRRFIKALEETSPTLEYIFLEKGIPRGAGWKRVGIEWEGYRVFARYA